MSAEQVTNWLNAGIQALKAGQKEEARRLLMQVIAADEQHEQGWLWLSGAVAAAAERQICLENVLTINPNNQAARRGLAQLGVAPPKNVPTEPEKGESDHGKMPAVDSPPTSQQVVVRKKYIPVSPAAAILHPEREAREWRYQEPALLIMPRM